MTQKRSQSRPHSNALLRMPIAGFLAWLVPGMGHIYLGYRGRGLVLLATITATFWTGVAIGGVRNTIDPKQRRLWFVAQMGTAGNTLAGYLLHKVVEEGAPSKNQVPSRNQFGHSQRTQPSLKAAPPGNWVSADVGVHYTGVAGLLNLLIILDALGRAELTSDEGQRKKRPKVGSS